MHFLVVAPIASGTRGPKAVNVGRILRDLVASGHLRSLYPPNEPTSSQLAALAASLESEIRTADFGDATQRLLVYLQIQEGLGDGLGGAVDQATATLLNDLVRRLGLPHSTKPPPDLRYLETLEASFSVSSRTFQLRYRAVGASRDRKVRLTPAAMTALIALKSSAAHFVFSPKSQSFIATDDLLQ